MGIVIRYQLNYTNRHISLVTLYSMLVTFVLYHSSTESHNFMKFKAFRVLSFVNLRSLSTKQNVTLTVSHSKLQRDELAKYRANAYFD